MEPFKVIVNYVKDDSVNPVNIVHCDIVRADIKIESTIGLDITNEFEIKQISTGTFTINRKPNDHEN